MHICPADIFCSFLTIEISQSDSPGVMNLYLQASLLRSSLLPQVKGSHVIFHRSFAEIRFSKKLRSGKDMPWRAGHAEKKVGSWKHI